MNKIKKLMQERRLTAKEVADAVGVRTQTIYNWMNAKSLPRYGEVLERVAKFFDVPVLYLLTDENEEAKAVVSEEGYVLIPHLEASAACGAGFINGDFLPMVKLIKVGMEWLRIHAPYANYRNLNILTAEGDSMLPTIKPGDLILIDRSDTQVRFDGLYVFTKDDSLFLKRIQKLGNGLRILSDNSSVYPPFEITGSEAQEVRILGKVVSVGKFEAM